MPYLSKYSVARTIRIPLRKAGSNNHANAADYTPAAGDVKISKDGAASANVTNLPTAVVMGNTTIWVFALTVTEMQATQVTVTIADSVTKAVEDDGFVIETYGATSALHEFDLDTPSVAQTENNATRLTDIQARLPAALIGGLMSSNIKAIDDDTTVDTIFKGMLLENISGAATAGSTTSATIPSLAGRGVNFFVNDEIGWSSGPNAGQKRIITSYVTATGVFGFAAFDNAVASGHVAYIDPAVPVAGAGADPWAVAVPGAYGAGTAGNILGNRLDVAISTRLAPTVAARTLDVSAGGNAGIDWANIEAPTTFNDLNNTNVNTVSTVLNLGTNIITSTQLAASAVDEIVDAVWDELIAGHLAANTTGARLNAAGVAGDPWTVTLPAAYGAGTAGFIIGTTVPAIKAKTDLIPTDPADASDLATLLAVIQADTDNLQTRLPAALVGGRMDVSVGAMATDVITSGALNANFSTELYNAMFKTAVVPVTTAPGVNPTLEQAIVGSMQRWRNADRTGAIGTVYAPDGVTPIYNLDFGSATDPDQTQQIL